MVINLKKLSLKWLPSNTSGFFELKWTSQGQSGKNHEWAQRSHKSPKFRFYFPQFLPIGQIPKRWHLPRIFGFSWGNPNGYQLFEWNPNFGMTVFMTPVDKNSNPLPTRVFYRWASDGEYQSLTDRAQSTWMVYSNYNPNSSTLYEDAYMYGISPSQIKPPPTNSGSNFLFNQSRNGTRNCTTLKIDIALSKE